LYTLSLLGLPAGSPFSSYPFLLLLDSFAFTLRLIFITP
jgi:hypothetical protein